MSTRARGAVLVAGCAGAGAALAWWLPVWVAVAGAASAGTLAALLGTRAGASMSAPARVAPVVAPAPLPLRGLVAMLEPLSEGVALFDRELRLVAANAAADAILGRAVGAMAGATLVQALRDHDLAQLTRSASGVATPVHLSGPGRDAQALARRVGGGEGEGAAYTLLVVRDETELAHARRARTELVAHLSHELRTPLAAARAVAETLQAGVDDEAERQRFLDRMIEQVDRLAAIVDRLLRLARLESGQEAFTLGAVEPDALLAAAARSVAPLAERRDVHLDVQAAGSAVRADRERVLEVLSNLLDNALRYSPDGGRVALGSAPDADAMVRFWVRDDGPGILPSDRERIFERFYTGDAARAAGGGTGLGLSIARQIVQRLGGRIWVAEEARGARICFTLPQSTDAAGASDEERAAG